MTQYRSDQKLHIPKDRCRWLESLITKAKTIEDFFQVVFSRRVSLFVVRLKRKFSTTSFFFALFLKYIVYGQTSCRSDTDYLKLEAIVIKFVI